MVRRGNKSCADAYYKSNNVPFHHTGTYKPLATDTSTLNGIMTSLPVHVAQNASLITASLSPLNIRVSGRIQEDMICDGMHVDDDESSN